MFRRLITFPTTAFLLLILTCPLVWSQPAAEWIRHFHNGRAEGFWDIYAASDSSYIMCGSSGQTWTSGGVFFLVKIDRNGNEIWSNTYGEGVSAHARTLIEADNGYTYISDYTRADWHFGQGPRSSSCRDGPFDACVVGCKTKQKEFQLKLKFKTVHERWKGYNIA